MKVIEVLKAEYHYSESLIYIIEHDGKYAVIKEKTSTYDEAVENIKNVLETYIGDTLCAYLEVKRTDSLEKAKDILDRLTFAKILSKREEFKPSLGEDLLEEVVMSKYDKICVIFDGQQFYLKPKVV